MKQLNGVFSGAVTDNVDPENLARVKVHLPRINVSGQKGDETWARMSTSMAGKNREACSVPEVGDEVLVAFETGGVTVNASAKVSINASQIEISAGVLTVDAGMSKFSGVVQCDTLIANGVVSASYTPGAGNIW